MVYINVLTLVAFKLIGRVQRKKGHLEISYPMNSQSQLRVLTLLTLEKAVQQRSVQCTQNLLVVSLAFTAIYWNTSISPIANKLLVSAMLQGNAGGYLVRQMTLVGIGGEHSECQTPTLVDKDPYTRLCSPHWRTTATQPLCVMRIWKIFHLCSFIVNLSRGEQFLPAPTAALSPLPLSEKLKDAINWEPS